MIPFEKRLTELPLRPPPPDWRETILAAADSESRRKVIPFPAFLRAHPVAWGALAACWLVIGFLNFAGPSGADLNSLAGEPHRMPSAAQTVEYFERRQLLLRWPGAAETIFQLDRTKL